MSDTVDCLIIGGGPAGLTGAIYAGRLGLDVVVIDAGDSRALLIACSHNHAGFPDGVSGKDLLARMSAHALKAGAKIIQDHVHKLARNGDGFVATLSRGEVRARAVLLATGVTNRRPEMSEELHAKALASGRLRYCPVCDGFEVRDQIVGVLGSGGHGAAEALFLRTFTRHVTLIAPQRHQLSADERASLKDAEVVLLEGPASDIRLEDDGISVLGQAGRAHVQTLYPALGSDPHSSLAVMLDAKITGEGCVVVDAHQRCTIPGLYAAGDVVIGLDQISHAMGEAGVAATTIRNDLAAARPMYR